MNTKTELTTVARRKPLASKSCQVIRRSGAAALLQVKPAMLDELPLRTWKEGRTTFYDSAEIMALIRLRDYRPRHRRTAAR